MNKIAFAFIMTLVVFVGCSQESGPSENEIKTTVNSYGEVNHRVWAETALPVDQLDKIDSIEVIEKGNFNKQGNYYPIWLGIRGTRFRGSFKGDKETFHEIIDAQVRKDDYGKWTMHIEKSLSVLGYDKKQDEAKRNLGQIGVIEEVFYKKNGRYTEDINWQPPKGNYIYYLGAKVYGSATAANLSLPKNVRTWVNGNSYQVVAVGNIDSDATLDVWTYDNTRTLNNVINDAKD